MTERPLRVAIIGYGVVGRATETILNPAAEVLVIDPDVEPPADPRADVAIIASPCADGRVDCTSFVGFTEAPVVFVRSTVTPKALVDLEAALPGSIVVSWPEFLTERIAMIDVRHPDKVIVGVDSPQIVVAGQAFGRMIDPEVLESWRRRDLIAFVPRRAAALAKLGINALYMLKGLLFNALWDAAAGDEATYRAAIEVMAADHRLRVSHAVIWQDGYRGLGGKCLPKDTGILAGLTSPDGAAFLDAALAFNRALLEPAAALDMEGVTA